MIVLRFSEETAQVVDWVETLKNLSLAHRLETEETLVAPQLSHSGDEYIGATAISTYLDQLDAESGDWWYCACGG